MSTELDTMEADLHILQHSLGLDQYGRGRSYRNHFVSGPGCDNFGSLCSLVDRGLMQVHGSRGQLTGGGHLFRVTDAGRSYVREHSLREPKLTASQRRYRAFLAEDSGMRFGEWLQTRRSR